MAVAQTAVSLTKMGEMVLSILMDDGTRVAIAEKPEIHHSYARESKATELPRCLDLSKSVGTSDFSSKQTILQDYEEENQLLFGRRVQV